MTMFYTQLFNDFNDRAKISWMCIKFYDVNGNCPVKSSVHLDINNFIIRHTVIIK